MLDTLLLERFVAEEQARVKRIRVAWDRYYGQFPKALRETRSDPRGEDNIALNLCRLIVDKSVSFLFGFALQLNVDEKAERESEAGIWLGECLEANRRMTTLHKAGTNGGVAGHVFLKLLPPDPARNGHPYPRMVVWDPAGVSVRWDPTDYERVLSYAYTWHGVDPQTVRSVSYRQVIEREGAGWTIVDQTGNAGTGWRDVRPPAVWPHSWPPVVHCQNLPAANEFWGRADLEEDLIANNADLNFTASNINRILRGHAHPRTWARGVAPGEFRLGPDEVAVLPGTNAELHTLAPASDLTSSLEFFRELRSLIHSMARVPEVAAGRVEDLGALSGLALQILYGPLCELTETKRLTYGEMLRELAQRLLELGGQGAEHRVEPQWPAVLPNDPKGDAETALLQHQVGASKETLLARLGFDPAAEAERRQVEDAAAAQLAAEQMKRFDQGGDDELPDDQE